MNGLNLWYQRCFFLNNQIPLFWLKKKSILLENKMNHDRHKMISLVLNKEAKCTIFVFNTVCRVWRPRPYISTQISLECLPPPSQPFPPSRDITSIQKYSYHEEVCCWKKWATFDQRASSQMYSSTRSYHSQTDFCIPESHDKPLILRYSKVEEVLTVK